MKKNDNQILRAVLLFSVIIFFGLSLSIVYSFQNKYIYWDSENFSINQSNLDIQEIKRNINNMDKDEIEKAITDIEKEINRLKSGI